MFAHWRSHFRHSSRIGHALSDWSSSGSYVPWTSSDLESSSHFNDRPRSCGSRQSQFCLKPFPKPFAAVASRFKWLKCGSFGCHLGFHHGFRTCASPKNSSEHVSHFSFVHHPLFCLNFETVLLSVLVSFRRYSHRVFAQMLDHCSTAMWNCVCWALWAGRREGEERGRGVGGGRGRGGFSLCAALHSVFVCGQRCLMRSSSIEWWKKMLQVTN